MSEETAEAGVEKRKIMISVDADLVARVDDFRRYREGELLSRGDSIVELIELGLKAGEGSVKRKR